MFHQQLAASGAKINDLTTMDAGTQVQDFNQAVAQKPDLIVLAVLDTKAMVVPIEKAKQAGIPVLVFDGRTDPAVAGDVMSVLSDNVALGEFAAQNIIDGLKAQGRTSGNIIVLTGTKSMLVTQDRMQGFDKVMATAPQYKVVNEQDANWDPTLSGQIAQQLLARYGCGGVQAAYGMADYMALPIIQAAKQAGCASAARTAWSSPAATASRPVSTSIQARPTLRVGHRGSADHRQADRRLRREVPVRSEPAAARDRAGGADHAANVGSWPRSAATYERHRLRPAGHRRGLAAVSAGCRRCGTCPSPSAPGRSTPCAGTTAPARAPW